MQGRNVLKPLVGFLVIAAIALAAHGAWNMNRGATFEATTSNIAITDANAEQAWDHNEARSNQIERTSTAGFAEVVVAVGLVILAIGTYFYRRRDGITLREIAAMF
ncbi:hypothetical protein HOF40_01905 [Candidatus Parcubacteria bacterium]|jgi:hypothetical protein|nr:hypothetical protein [Candidatus Parcubacteria bacterium]MBT3948821.1 hypothetical protein [Candidatus Parcubacteria bacterium]